MTRFFGIISFLMVTHCQQPYSIDVQGHRGCRGLYPENSIPAFEKAVELGVTTIELDVVITADNQVLVSHEPYMRSGLCRDIDGKQISKTNQYDFNIYQMSYKEVSAFNCGTLRHPDYQEQELLAVSKRLLKDVVLRCDNLNTDIRYNIEIKADKKWDGIFTPGPDEFVDLVMQLRTLFGSQQHLHWPFQKQ